MLSPALLYCPVPCTLCCPHAFAHCHAAPSLARINSMMSHAFAMLPRALARTLLRCPERDAACFALTLPCNRTNWHTPSVPLCSFACILHGVPFFAHIFHAISCSCMHQDRRGALLGRILDGHAPPV
ncbi:hypothetical protein AMTRI_Chr12g269350 [Amborella trichopoda]